MPIKIKRITCVFLLLCFICSSISVINVKAGQTEINIPRKIISLVYDDSGSMFKDGRKWWSQANYALQAFAALLNPQDKLYVTFMSDVRRNEDNPPVWEADLSNPQNAIDEIRSNQHWGQNTPITSLDVAAKKLLEENDLDTTTQYWMVVLTDGNPEEKKNGVYTDEKSDTNDYQKVLERIAAQTAPNGTELQIKFVHLGDEAINDVPGNGRNFVVEDGKDIVKTLNKISNEITGRLPANKLTVNNDTITIETDLPLYSISVFTQNSNASVLSAQNDKKLIFDNTKDISNLSLRYIDDTVYKDDKSGSTSLVKISEMNYITDDTLFGNACLITGPDSTENIIPTGTYTIKCSEPVSKNDVTVMLQPAIELQVVIHKDGKELISEEDFKELMAPDDIEVEVRPVDPITKEVISSSLLPEGTSWNLKFETSNNYVNEVQSTKLKDTITQDENIISGFMQIPNMCPQMIEDIYIIPNDYIDLDISVKKQGVEVTDFDTLNEGDILDIQVIPVNEVSRIPIDPNFLPTGVTWSIDYSIDGNTIQSVQQNSLTETTAVGHNNIHVEMSIPDKSGNLNTKINDVDFDITVYEPVLTTSNVIVSKTDPLDPAVIYDEANNINDFTALEYGDEIKIEWSIIDQNTGAPVDISKIAGGNAQEIWNLTHSIDGTDINASSTNTLITTVTTGHNVINGSYQVGNTVTSLNPIEFDILPPGIYSMESTSGSIPYLRSKVQDTPNIQKAEVKITFQEDADNDGVGDGTLTYPDITSLTNKEPLIKSVNYTKDNKGLLRSNLAIFSTEPIVEGDTSNNVFYVYPKASWIKRTFLPYLIKTGEYTVDLELSSDSSKVVQITYSIEGRSSDWLVALVEFIILSIVLYILFILFGKKKFANGTIIELKVYNNSDGVMMEVNRESQTLYLPNYGQNKILPSAAKYRIPKIGVTVYADSNGTPYFKLKNVKRNTWGTYGGSGFMQVLSAIEAQTKKRTDKNYTGPDTILMTRGKIYFKSGYNLISINLGTNKK